MRIGGIYKPNALFGSYLVGGGFFRRALRQPAAGRRADRDRSGGTSASAQGAVGAGLTPYPNLTVQTQAEFEKTQQAQVNQLLGLVYVLLALAVLIALIGIVNTLMLSVFERTHEIGLLRAVGMRRRQVRAMIRSEAVILSIFGAIIGLVLGTGLGVALSESLKTAGDHRHRRPLLEPGRLPGHRRAPRAGGGLLAGPPGRQARRPGGDRRRVTPWSRGALPEQA